MKSLYRNVGGQLKLRGKRTKLLSCKCCVAYNYKYDHSIKVAKKEIKDAYLVEHGGQSPQ